MKKTKKILVRLYGDFPFKLGDLEEGVKTFEGRRLTSIDYFEATKENVALAQEHNNLLKEMELLDRKRNEVKNKMK